MKFDNLTVVICNYNLIDHLKIVSKRVKEIAPEVEIILADDHSTDGSFEWASSSGLFDNIYYKPIREPYCLCHIRNKAIHLSTKKFVLLLDSSCYPSDFCIQSHLKLLELDEKNVSQGEVIYLQTQQIPSSYSVFNANEIYQDAPASGGNIAFPISAWKKIKGFDESFDGTWGLEDNDFLIMLIKNGYNVLTHRSSVAFHMPHERKCLEAFSKTNHEKITNKYFPGKSYEEIINIYFEIEKNDIKLKKSTEKIILSCLSFLKQGDEKTQNMLLSFFQRKMLEDTMLKGKVSSKH